MCNSQRCCDTPINLNSNDYRQSWRCLVRNHGYIAKKSQLCQSFYLSTKCIVYDANHALVYCDWVVMSPGDPNTGSFGGALTTWKPFKRYGIV